MLLRSVRLAHARENGFPEVKSAAHIAAFRDDWRKNGPPWYDEYLLNSAQLKSEPRAVQVLVVVDTQTGFASYNPDQEGFRESSRLVCGVRQQVRLARRLGWPIVFLEFSGFGETVPEVRKALQEPTPYPKERYRVMAKNDRDGSEQVLAACRDGGFPTQRFRVCGCNTNQCVQDTVMSLLAKVPGARVELATRACWPNEFGYWVAYINTKNALLLPPAKMPTPLPSRLWWNMTAIRAGVT